MPKTTELPVGVTVHRDKLRITFQYKGQRCRESTGLPVSPRNIKAAANLKSVIEHEIRTNTFDYRKHFPNSPRAKSLAPSAEYSVADLLSKWLRVKRGSIKESSYALYLQAVDKVIIPRLGEVSAEKLKPSDIALWLNELDVSKSRAELLITPLKGAYKLAIVDGELTSSPVHGLRSLVKFEPPIAKPDPFSVKELSALRLALGAKWPVFQFMYQTGLRPGEVRALQWDCVDIAHSEIRVTRNYYKGKIGTPKTRSSSRTVKLIPDTVELLKNVPNTGTYVFDISRHQSEFTRVWKKGCEGAGVRYRPVKQLRHTYASLSLSAGEHPMFVAKQMGHSDWGMIRKVYGKWMPDTDPEAGSRFAATLRRTPE